MYNCNVGNIKIYKSVHMYMKNIRKKKNYKIFKGLKLIRICLFLLFLTIPVFTGLANQDNIEVNIRFYNQKIYYLNTVDEIQVEIKIMNKSLEPFYFKVADEKIYNIDFIAHTQQGIEFNTADILEINRNNFNIVYFKELILNPGEEYGFIVNLSKYIELDKSGRFPVYVRFYPNLLTDSYSEYLSSNSLQLYIWPSGSFPETEDMQEAGLDEIVQRIAMPPDQVVSKTIEALQQQNWPMFLLYLDIESFILDNENWNTRYLNATEENRMIMREIEYPNLLKEQFSLDNQAGDEQILYVPDRFVINRTTYNETIAEVEVMVYFEFRDYIELKRYTYYLEKKENFWMITRYKVVNAWNESR